MRFTAPTVRTYAEADGASRQGTTHEPLPLSPSPTLTLTSALSFSRRTRSISSWHLFVSFLFLFPSFFVHVTLKAT